MYLLTGQLASWDKYRELELQLKQNAVNEAGDLLEYETLELRIHPPNVRIDNDLFDDRTVLIIDSANRPGTLVEVLSKRSSALVITLALQQTPVISKHGHIIVVDEVTDYLHCPVVAVLDSSFDETLARCSLQVTKRCPVYC